jgi:aspartate 1-decarboxylase
MLRWFCLSKVYNASVTDLDVEYEGSIGIDRAIVEAAGLAKFEKVLVINVTNTHRFETYVIEEEAGSGKFALYGGAAKLAKIGDSLILLSFGGLNEREIETFEGPRVLRLRPGNRLPE